QKLSMIATFLLYCSTGLDNCQYISILRSILRSHPQQLAPVPAPPMLAPGPVWKSSRHTSVSCRYMDVPRLHTSFHIVTRASLRRHMNFSAALHELLHEVAYALIDNERQQRIEPGLYEVERYYRRHQQALDHLDRDPVEIRLYDQVGRDHHRRHRQGACHEGYDGACQVAARPVYHAGCNDKRPRGYNVHEQADPSVGAQGER